MNDKYLTIATIGMKQDTLIEHKEVVTMCEGSSMYVDINRNMHLIHCGLNC
jgi:hypothetical protein